MKMKLTIGAAVCVLCVVLAVAFWPNAPERDAGLDASADAPATPELRPDEAVAHITVLLDHKAPLVMRIEALRSIKRELVAEEVADLRALVRRSSDNETVRNDVLALLQRQPTPPNDLGVDLIAMWNDEKESAVWRDYCLQHMAHVYSFDRDRHAIEDALIAASKLTEGTFPGTAMLSMNRISGASERIRTALREVAVRTTLDEKTNKNVAVTAMQVARAAGDTTVLDRARELAAKEGEQVRLRMSAIGTLGELGYAVDVPVLEKLTTHKEDRISRVAKYNLKRLKKRTSKSQ